MECSAPKTISLIGMPGVGKSTVGVVLAKKAGLDFVDTDLCIQIRHGVTLQQILEREGYLKLRALEEEVLTSLPLEGYVVSTGGSVVYSEHSMQRLCAAGSVVYLRAKIPLLERRVSAGGPRGIASEPGQSFASLYAGRTPLYESYCDFIRDVDSDDPETIAQWILERTC